MENKWEDSSYKLSSYKLPRIEFKQNLAANEQTGPIKMRNLIISLKVCNCRMAVPFLLHHYLLLTPSPASPSYSLTFTCISHPDSPKEYTENGLENTKLDKECRCCFCP